MDAETLRQYRYHRANGGTAEGSLACARTRILLDRAIDENVAEIRWDYEEERYEDVFGFEDDAERKWFYDGIENGSITGRSTPSFGSRARPLPVSEWSRSARATSRTTTRSSSKSSLRRKSKTIYGRRSAMRSMHGKALPRHSRGSVTHKPKE